MIKYYYHGGSRNHGCEAIIRSTSKILDTEACLYSANPEQDLQYGLDKVCGIKEDKQLIIEKKSLPYLISAVYKKITGSDYLIIKYMHKAFFDDVKKGDVYLSVGGDNYCYAGNERLGFYNRAIHGKGAKTVLWGCSFESDIMDDDLIKDIESYDAIIARESISYEALKSVNPNTFLYPDPAFQLDYTEKALPGNFIDGNTVGINISPLIMSYEKNYGTAYKNYLNLIGYILKNTNMNIALIPHVVDKRGSDTDTLKLIYDEFSDTGRIVLIDDCNCMELKGYIKRCRFLVTARTHASIAAYSTCVPTLVAGYSVKAKGIAKDIFGAYENYVLPVQDMENEDELTESFKWLMKNETDIKKRLEAFMPEYCGRALKAGEKIKELL